MIKQDAPEPVIMATSKFTFWYEDSQTINLLVKSDAPSTKRLNKLLRYYPQDTVFRADDEPVFQFAVGFNRFDIEVACGMPRDTLKGKI